MILERLSVSMERITELFSLTISKGKLELMDNSSEMTRSLSRLFYHEVDYNHIFDENLSNNEKGTGFIKWRASSRWSSCLYCPMQNSDQMTIGKTHPSLSLALFIKIIIKSFLKYCEMSFWFWSISFFLFFDLWFSFARLFVDLTGWWWSMWILGFFGASSRPGEV